MSQLINVEDVMENCNLGPNGALVYCMEYLENNLDWFFAQVTPYINTDHYFLFDLPGQVLYFFVIFIVAILNYLFFFQIKDWTLYAQHDCEKHFEEDWSIWF